jgi:selenocysteine-specific elongation factor
MENYVQILLKDPFSPATTQEIPEDLLNLLEETGRIVRISADIVYEAETYIKMVNRITTHAQDSGTISVSEVRDMFNTSRKYALPLLEHLDQRRITRRVGDSRILR